MTTETIELVRLLLPTVFSVVLSAVLGAVLGWVAGARKHRMEEAERIEAKTDANNDLTKCIARIFLVDFYDRFVVADERMSIERWEEIDRLYKAYKALGGNGTGDKLYNELLRKRTYIVNETTREGAPHE